jgi:hypothetical protein
MKNDVGVEMLRCRYHSIVADVDRVKLQPSTLTGLAQVVGVTGAEIVDDQDLPVLIDEAIGQR